MSRDRTGRAVALTLAVCAGLACHAQAAVAPQDADGAGLPEAQPVRLATASWLLRTPLGEASGRLLAIIGDAGDWRLEIGLAAAGQMTDEQLLNRHGEGWTFSALDAEAFAQRWGEGWRPLPAGAGGSIGDLIGTWLNGGDGAPRTAGTPRRWHAPGRGRPPRWTLPALASLIEGEFAGDADELRSVLVERGTGRGGAQLGVEGRHEGGEFHLTSRRWPGRLDVGTAVPHAIVLPVEAFLPLWPLADFRD